MDMGENTHRAVAVLFEKQAAVFVLVVVLDGTAVQAVARRAFDRIIGIAAHREPFRAFRHKDGIDVIEQRVAGKKRIRKPSQRLSFFGIHRRDVDIFFEDIENFIAHAAHERTRAKPECHGDIRFVRDLEHPKRRIRNRTAVVRKTIDARCDDARVANHFRIDIRPLRTFPMFMRI